MAQLHQIQIVFAPLQDRLLLRVNTDDQTQYRFWITRRYLKLLWPTLGKLAAADPIVQQQSDASAKQEVVNFRQEQVMRESDFSKSFEETQQQLPLGDEPILLARIQTKSTSSGGQVLCLHPEQGEGIELALNGNLIHALMGLLATAVAQSEWDIKLKSEHRIADTANAELTIN